MMRRVVFLATVCGCAHQSLPAESPKVGTFKQLLVDDCVVGRITGLRRVVQQPRRLPENPILKGDQPWEGKRLQMPCVLWDPRLRLYHMYYWAIHSGDTIYTCYARSTDGKRWEKPRLNLHVGPDGTKKNNIVLRGEGRVARTRYVVLNPRRDDPERRFLALYIDNVPNLTEFAASSPDGLHWRTEKKIGDLRSVRGGPVTSDPPFFLLEQQWVTDPKDGHRYRGIWRTESRDMHTWSGGRLVIERLADDDRDLEFYHAAAGFVGTQSYHGLHFGYLYLFHTETRRGVRQDGVRLAGTVDTALMISRDTVRWTRVDRRRRFLPLGPDGSWEAGMNFVSPEVIVGDGMRFYYSAHKRQHSAADNESAIGLATLPLDRFVAVEPEPGKERGSLTTKPFELRGKGLSVNADAEKGEIRVAVTTDTGAAIPGYDAASCEPISTDELRAEVRWRDKSLRGLRGRRIRLEFQLTRPAQLFAFEVR